MKDHMEREASSLAVPTGSSPQLTYINEPREDEQNHQLNPQNHKKRYILIVLYF